MSETSEAYNALVNAGVNPDVARQFIKDETGDDPVSLESVRVTIRLKVEGFACVQSQGQDNMDPPPHCT